MTRRPKTPRTPRQTALLVVSNIFGTPIGGGFRRQPKGRRAKSGQWWRREPQPMTFAELADYSFRQSEKKAARMRPPEPMPDWRERVVIDEAAEPIPMDLLERCDPKLTSGTARVISPPERFDLRGTDAGAIE